MAGTRVKIRECVGSLEQSSFTNSEDNTDTKYRRKYGHSSGVKIVANCEQKLFLILNLNSFYNEKKISATFRI